MIGFKVVIRTAICSSCGRTWADGSTKVSYTQCAPGIGCKAK